MKRSFRSDFIFWAIVIIVATIVISVTAGTYYQYKMASTEPINKESISMTFKVLGDIPNLWTLLSSLF